MSRKAKKDEKEVVKPSTRSKTTPKPAGASNNTKAGTTEKTYTKAVAKASTDTTTKPMAASSKVIAAKVPVNTAPVPVITKPAFTTSSSSPLIITAFNPNSQVSSTVSPYPNRFDDGRSTDSSDYDSEYYSDDSDSESDSDFYSDGYNPYYNDEYDDHFFNRHRCTFDSDSDVSDESGEYVLDFPNFLLMREFMEAPQNVFLMNARRYLVNMQRDAGTSAIVRARIESFLLSVDPESVFSAFYMFTTIRRELEELSGRPLEGYPVFDYSSSTHNSATPSALREDQISALPRHIYRGQTQKEKRTGEEPHKCCICMAQLEIGEELVRLEKCGHRFHYECLGSWLRRSNQCPICRTVILPPAQSIVIT